jgi:hypothetical protein
MKYKYKLTIKENEETGGSGRLTIKKDITLTPLGSSTVQDVVNALEKIDNYGTYISNARNTKPDIEKALTDHFGPNQIHVKKKLEKERGKPFPVKTKAAIDAFIKTLSDKPSLLQWKVAKNTLIFPSTGNPTKEMTEKIIKTVMNNAGLDYNLGETASEESMNESQLRKVIKEQINKLFKKK